MAWRAVISSEFATPRMNAITTLCQRVISPVSARNASPNACSIITDCMMMTTLRLSMRSTSTPAGSVSSSAGTAEAKPIKPR